MTTTRQTIDLASKEGKTFLRKIVKHNASCSMREDWNLRARASEGWRIIFERTIPGQVGEPDEEVIVTTDQQLSVSGKFGEVQSFDDSKPVSVVEPRGVYLNGETALAAKLLADGFRLELQCSAGSTSSSQYGLSFYRLSAVNRDISCYSLCVGTETIAKDGRTIVSGAAHL